jgi:hypothetical protein
MGISSARKNVQSVDKMPTPFNRPRSSVTVGRSMMKVPSTTGENVPVPKKLVESTLMLALSNNEASTVRRQSRLFVEFVQLALRRIN